jgi:hypothetical protein
MTNDSRVVKYVFESIVVESHVRVVHDLAFQLGRLWGRLRAVRVLNETLQEHVERFDTVLCEQFERVQQSDSQGEVALGKTCLSTLSTFRDDESLGVMTNLKVI